jgi:hypothetical protein
VAIRDRILSKYNARVEEIRASTGVQVATYARAQRDVLIRQGVASPVYITFTDGVESAPEEKVKLDEGTIAYLFSNINEAIVYALARARELSPVKSGEYKDSWFVALDGIPFIGNIADIPKGSRVIITNKQRYHRKIDTGGQITSVPPGITEAVRQAVMRRYPGLQVDREFVTIPGDPPLKGMGVESGLSYVRAGRKKKGNWVRKRAPRPARAKDRRAGQPLTYPAVIISERVR